MAEEYIEPISSSSLIPPRLSERGWLDLTTAFACLVNGQPHSGKTKLCDYITEVFWVKHFTIIWLWCGGGWESLYMTINRNCRERWKKLVEKDPKLKRRLPACQCYDTIPIVWLIPYYFEIEQDSLDRFNGVYWSNWEEYNKCYEECSPYVTQYMPPEVDVTKIKKPVKLRPRPLIKTIKFHPPVDDSDIPTFRKEFYDAIKIAKNEHRIIVHTPECYTPDHKGKVERFHTVGGVLDYIYDELSDDPLFDHISNPQTKKEENNHKIAIVMTEFKKPCPNLQFQADREATVSRRAIYGFMPEKGHKNTWVLADCQSATDIHDKTRMQFSELKIFKRTTLALIGDENKEFFNGYNKYCNDIYVGWGFNPTRVPTFAKLRLIAQYNMCRIPELPDNKMIIKLENGERIMRTVKHARFHHKDRKYDKFMQLSGLKFKLNRMTHKIETDTKKPTKTTSKRKYQETVMLRIQQWLKEGKKFNQMQKLIQDHLENTDPPIIPKDLGYGSKSYYALYQQYTRWLDKQA